VKNNFQVP